MNLTKKLAIAVVALSLALVFVVGGTLAYLVSETATVTNTFTVGDVSITLDETDVDGSRTGVTTEGRDIANKYKLVPGMSYVKDPTVHVAGGNEKCYVFVQVTNGIAALEAADNTIESQIAAKNWTGLDGVEGVYYKLVEASESDTDLVVFDGFKIAETVDKTALESINDGTAVTVIAYAIQYLGFESDVNDAWRAVSASANA